MSTPTASTQPRVDNAAIAGLVLGGLSLVALVFPPALGLGIAAIVICLTARRRIRRSSRALRGSSIAVIGLVLGIIGTLEGMVLPGLFAYVYIYALFHGGHTPGIYLP